MIDRLRALEEQQALARSGGGPRYIERHRSRGRLLARERIELLVDEDAAFLELSTVAAWGTDYTVGASVVTGIGVVSDVECMIVAHDPTVRGGASNPYTWKKVLRAMTIARENRLPTINLVESGGGDLRNQVDLFVPAGRLFHELTALSAAGVPTIALVFGNSTAGGAYVPGMCDYAVMVDQQAKVFLGGPPLVKMATGEDADEESLGGADMHSRVSGLSDYLAADEVDCIAIGRRIVEHLNWRKLGPGPRGTGRPPRLRPRGSARHRVGRPQGALRPEGGAGPGRGRIPIRGVQAAVRFRPGHRVGVGLGLPGRHRGQRSWRAVQRGGAEGDRVHPALQPVGSARWCSCRTRPGSWWAPATSSAGIVKDGAKMINAVTNSSVPHLTINMGASYGAGNYGMSGRSYDPRLLFTWPNAKTAIMGPEQLAGVMSIVARQAAEASGRPFDEEAEAGRRAELEARVEAESLAMFMSGQLYDDGLIDPRDTRTVLGIALSVCHNNVIEGTRGYGVFRM